MKNFVHSVLEKEYQTANERLSESFASIMEKKLFEMKRRLSAKMFAEMKLDGIKPAYDQIEDRRGNSWTKIFNPDAKKAHAATKQTTNTAAKTDLQRPQETNSSAKTDLKEEESLDEARIKILTRVRGGKIQRRKKLSNVEGMTLRGGKLTRMSPAERRRRKMGARRGKVKRKSKMGRALMKRKRSMIRRKAMGL
jgi:hypothetical protein